MLAKLYTYVGGIVAIQVQGSSTLLLQGLWKVTIKDCDGTGSARITI